MRNASNNGTPEKTRKNSIQGKSTLTGKTTDIAERTTNQERRKTEVVPREERVASTWSTQIEGRPLALLLVYCRSICNKILVFWNLIDTYNPDVVIGTESWLSEEINNAEIFRDDYITFRRDRGSRGGVVFICVKITSIAGCYGRMRFPR
jgi:hypothetical protein